MRHIYRPYKDKTNKQTHIYITKLNKRQNLKKCGLLSLRALPLLPKPNRTIYSNANSQAPLHIYINMFFVKAPSIGQKALDPIGQKVNPPVNGICQSDRIWGHSPTIFKILCQKNQQKI